METHLKKAAEAYQRSGSCEYAVRSAFRQELNGSGKQAGDWHQQPGVCGAFRAAAAVIKAQTDDPDAIKRAAEYYKREYGSIYCREILKGEAPRPFACGMKVKDAVLLVYTVLKEENV